MRFVMLYIAIFLVSGCASKHKTHMSKQTGATVDDAIKVSVEKNTEMSTRNFVVLEFTIENTGNDYRRYESIDIELPTKIKNQVKVVVGQDLVNWSEGIKNKIELEDFNRRTFIAGMTAVAGASAALSKDVNYAKVAGGVAAAGYGTLAVDRFLEVRNAVKNSDKYDLRGLIPQNHILSTPVSVPPNLFLKRFAVMYIDKNADFRYVNMRFNGAQNTKNIKLQARFALEVPKLSKCEETKGTLYYKRFEIRCPNDCIKLHPLNRDKCIENYKRKFN